MPKHTAAERKKRRENRVTGNVFSTDTADFILPTREIEALEQRGKIVRKDPLKGTFIRTRQAEEQGRQAGLERQRSAQQLKEQQDAAARQDIEQPVEVPDGQQFGTDVVTGERVPLLSGQVSSAQPLLESIGGLGGLGAGGIRTVGRGALGAIPKKVTITQARKNLKKLGLNKGFKLFGFSIGLKELVVLGVGYTQRKMGNAISKINTEATTLGTERNEKIARWMISGLDPDTAIEFYTQDMEYLRDANETVQLLSIFHLADYVGLGDAKRTHLNIQNQIDGKLSRIAESEKFKLGLNIADIQENLDLEQAESEVESGL